MVLVLVVCVASAARRPSLDQFAADAVLSVLPFHYSLHFSTLVIPLLSSSTLFTSLLSAPGY